MNRFTIYGVGLALMVLFTGQILPAQVNERIYFDKEGNSSSPSTAEFYITAQQNKKDKNLLAITGFFVAGQMKSQSNFLLKMPIEEIDLATYNKPEFWYSAVNDGKYIEWYKTGKLKEEGLYIKGLKEGTYNQFYENGKLQSVSRFKDGKANGMVSIYNENGTLNIQFMMVDNQIHGELTSYFENGEKKSSEKFKDNVKEGEAILWDPDGNEIVEEQ